MVTTVRARVRALVEVLCEVPDTNDLLELRRAAIGDATDKVTALVNGSSLRAELCSASVDQIQITTD